MYSTKSVQFRIIKKDTCTYMYVLYSMNNIKAPKKNIYLQSNELIFKLD